jgi:hypothetical protein
MVEGAQMRDEIRELLDSAYDFVLAEYGERGYSFWKGLIGDQINFRYPNDEGKQIEIMPVWDHIPGGKIRVAVSILAVRSWSEPTKCFFVNPDDSIQT